MRIKDLPAPVTTSNVTFALSTTWMGFTPTGKSEKAWEKTCDEIQKDINGGYTIEYVAFKPQKVKEEFKKSERYSRYLKDHKENKGCFVAVHRMSTVSQHLEDIMSQKEYEDLQNLWAGEEGQHRWSITFPVVESYEIVGRPKARDVLGEEIYKNIYNNRSRRGRLRIFDSEHRKKIASLEIIKRLPTPSDRISLDKRVKNNLDRDISEDFDAYPEGMTKERIQKVRQRATGLAERFIVERLKGGKLTCDLCQFDPLVAVNQTPVNSEEARLRFLLDVHHKYPLAEGTRQTTIEDFALLCPNCHRMEHLLLKHGHSKFKK